MKISRVVIVLTVTAIILALAAPAIAENPMPPAGKRVTITLVSEAKIGNLTLQPGEYVMEHQMKGDQHFVKFYPAQGRGERGEVACKMQPLPKKVADTAVFTNEEGGVRHITRIEMRGEYFAHTF